jgi:hypothetical protein
MSPEELDALWRECPCFYGYYVLVRWNPSYDITVDLT